MPKGFTVGDRALAVADIHPLWMMAHGKVGSYLITGASAAGQMHVARGLPRDDAFAVRAFGPWLAVAVADGVGSRPLSRYGASYVVESLTAELLRPLAPTLNSGKPTQPDKTASSSTAPPHTIEEAELKYLTLYLEHRLDRGKRDASGLRSSLADPTILGQQEQEIPAGPPVELDQAASVGWQLASQARVPPSGMHPADSQPESVEPESVLGVAAAGQRDLGKIAREAFDATHRGLHQRAQQFGLDLSDLSSTALAILLNCETGELVAGQVGDGAVLGLTANGEVIPLVKAHDTDDPQSTYTINRLNFKDHLSVQISDTMVGSHLDAVFVMTDGLSGDLLYSSDNGALPAWAKQVNRNLHLSSSAAQAAAGLLNWLATYQVKGSFDDRTLVVVNRERSSNGVDNPAPGQPESPQPTDN